MPTVVATNKHKWTQMGSNAVTASTCGYRPAEELMRRNSWNQKFSIYKFWGNRVCNRQDTVNTKNCTHALNLGLTKYRRKYDGKGMPRDTTPQANTLFKVSLPEN